MTNSINTIGGKMWKWILISFGSLVLVYGVVRIIPVMRGVDIKVFETIADNTNSDAMVITGNVRHARTLFINGRAVLINTEGDFADELILIPGMNKITITAEDVRGRTHTKELTMSGSTNIHEIKNEVAHIEKDEITN